jgi:hypothetical protein
MATRTPNLSYPGVALPACFVMLLPAYFLILLMLPDCDDLGDFAASGDGVPWKFKNFLQIEKQP